MTNNNNHKIFEEMIREAQSVRLSESKKSLIRENIVYFIKNGPVRNADLARQTGKKQLLIKLKFMPIFLAVMLLLGGGGAAAFAAESSLPGDILYPIKNVTEGARVALSLSTEAKAKAQTEFATRRLEEAEQLAAAGRLDARTEAEVKANFEVQSSEAVKTVEAIKASNHAAAAVAVSSNFEAAIKAHAKVLKGILTARAASPAPTTSDTLPVTTTINSDDAISAKAVIGAEQAPATEVIVSGTLINQLEVLRGAELAPAAAEEQVGADAAVSSDGVPLTGSAALKIDGSIK